MLNPPQQRTQDGPMHDENSTPPDWKQTQAERSHDLHESGLSWPEVGAEMGIGRVRAKNAAYYWRKRIERAAYGKARYEANRERILAQTREYRNANADVISERRRAHRALHRDEINATKRVEREANKDEINARRRGRYAEDDDHRAVLLARVTAYRAANLDTVRERAREYGRRPEIIEKRKAWVAANAEDLAEKQRAYRAERVDHTREVTLAWREANADHLRAYAQRYHEENRAELLLRRSIWEFGPELGPAHRALCDLRVAVRNKRKDQ